MKIRTGFVSNSSSASFTIWATDLTAEQIEAMNSAIIDRDTVIESLVLGYIDAVDGEWYDRWFITLSNDSISGYTICNNDCIWAFFDKLGIPRNIVHLCDDENGSWEGDRED